MLNRYFFGSVLVCVVVVLGMESGWLSKVSGVIATDASALRGRRAMVRSQK
jgi:hypothetical protein